MATRSLIGKYTNNNTTWEYIYCHWDGYPENNGKILIENYTTEEYVDKLLELGDLVSLGKYPAKTSDKMEDEDITIAYHRDRHQEKTLPIETDASMNNILGCIHSTGCDYGYIFNPKTEKWECVKYNWSDRELETIDLYTLEM